MKLAIIALAAATALAGAAHAQGYDRHDRYGYQGGDYYGRTGAWDYPQFRDVSWHIRIEIQQGLRDGWLDADRADAFSRQLRRIQYQEIAAYREHGWSLPQWQREAFRDRFDRLDHALDWARDRGGDHGDRGWGYDRR